MYQPHHHVWCFCHLWSIRHTMGGAAKTIIADIKIVDTRGQTGLRAPVGGCVSAVSVGTGMDGSTEIQFATQCVQGRWSQGCDQATIITPSFLKERLWI
jgi:hypothetical protein